MDVEWIGPSKVAAHPGDRGPTVWIPVVLRELAVDDFTAIGVPAPGHPKVQAAFTSDRVESVA